MGEIEAELLAVFREETGGTQKSACGQFSGSNRPSDFAGYCGVFEGVIPRVTCNLRNTDGRGLIEPPWESAR